MIPQSYALVIVRVRALLAPIYIYIYTTSPLYLVCSYTTTTILPRYYYHYHHSIVVVVV